MSEAANKYALVTGASSGIGRHLANQLAARGYNIIAVSNQAAELQELKSELSTRYGVHLRTIYTDLAEEDAATALFKRIRHEKLHVEVLVNNAGTMVFSEMVEVDPVKMNAVMLLHMNTPALLCRLFGKDMKTRGSGYILNVSSISAFMPYPTISLYGPSKAFLRSFSRAIRTEMKPYGIKVTCLIPGSTDTALNSPDSPFASLSRRLGKPMQAEKVAEAGLKALFKGRAKAIPGAVNKLIVRTVPLVPWSLINLAFRQMIKKRGYDGKAL